MSQAFYLSTSWYLSAGSSICDPQLHYFDRFSAIYLWIPNRPCVISHLRNNHDPEILNSAFPQPRWQRGPAPWLPLIKVSLENQAEKKRHFHLFLPLKGHLRAAVGNVSLYEMLITVCMSGHGLGWKGGRLERLLRTFWNSDFMFCKVWLSDTDI